MKRASLKTLIAANLLPVFGVLFLSWSVGQLLILYWLENVVYAFLNFFKIVKAEAANDKSADFTVNGKVSAEMGKLALAFFFLLHFGMFTAVHGVFVFAMFYDKAAIDIPGLLLGFITFIVSHFISYRVNYIGNGEHKVTSPNVQMMRPYKRIIIMHLTLLFGGVFVMGWGFTGAIPLLIFVGVKLALDMLSHTKEHYKYWKNA